MLWGTSRRVQSKANLRFGPTGSLIGKVKLDSLAWTGSKDLGASSLWAFQPVLGLVGFVLVCPGKKVHVYSKHIKSSV